MALWVVTGRIVSAAINRRLVARVRTLQVGHPSSFLCAVLVRRVLFGCLGLSLCV